LYVQLCTQKAKNKSIRAIWPLSAQYFNIAAMLHQQFVAMSVMLSEVGQLSCNLPPVALLPQRA
jgi:hypothetical protein